MPSLNTDVDGIVVVMSPTDDGSLNITVTDEGVIIDLYADLTTGPTATASFTFEEFIDRTLGTPSPNHAGLPASPRRWPRT